MSEKGGSMKTRYLRSFIILPNVLVTLLFFVYDAEAQIGTVSCDGFPQHPHQSKFEPDKVKVKMAYECMPTTTPTTITLQLTLQRRDFLFFWQTVGTSGPQARLVGATGARWNPNTLSATASCIDGDYRWEVLRFATSSDGVVIGPVKTTGPAIRVVCNKSVGMIIDDTGSMGNEIGAVKAALANFINSRDEEEYTLWQLTSFKDSVRNFGVTTENATILSQVNGLFASGGGDCPEEALGAIQSSISTLSSYPDHAKTLIVATDASAQSGDVDGIIAAARANGVQVNVLLTGDCDFPAESAATESLTRGSFVSVAVSGPLSSQVVLRRIAEETGGKYFFIPGGRQVDFEEALTEIFASVDRAVDVTPPSIEVQVSPKVLWPPNHKMQEIHVSLTVQDDTDPNPVVELVGVRCTEPFDEQGDGNTKNDIIIIEKGRIFVRAERSGSGNDRIYTITYKATDATGNFAFGSSTVTVPHDRR
jgi:hypothetical protein